MALQPDKQSALAHKAPKLPFIDALRGYAVLLVITGHVGEVFPNLPYPLRKITNFGWHGVQLFFLISCVTLLLSWHSEAMKGRTDILSFWIRRVFRIVPLYYIASAFYFAIIPPPRGFNFGQWLTTATFINAWSPSWIPTIPGKWMVVPGGWSVGVEITFYAIFPFIAFYVRSLRSALIFVAISIMLSTILNPLIFNCLVDYYGEAPTANFLYFWFPNQIVVFALGTVLFYTLHKISQTPQKLLPRLLRTRGTMIGLTCIAICVAVANTPFPEKFPLTAPFFIPKFVVASFVFMVFAMMLANAPDNIFVNRPIRSLGKASFSAYVVHFAIIHKLPELFPTIFSRQATNWWAILACGELWLAVVLTTYGVSLITYHAIEEPMIGVGRRLILARRRRLSAWPV